MKLGMPITYANDFRDTIEQLRDFEAAGLDRVMIPEAYGFDAVSQMGYAAAMTNRVELAFGILPMFFGFWSPNFAQNVPVRQNAAEMANE